MKINFDNQFSRDKYSETITLQTTQRQFNQYSLSTSLPITPRLTYSFFSKSPKESESVHAGTNANTFGRTNTSVSLSSQLENIKFLIRQKQEQLAEDHSRKVDLLSARLNKPEGCKKSFCQQLIPPVFSEIQAASQLIKDKQLSNIKSHKKANELHQRLYREWLYRRFRTAQQQNFNAKRERRSQRSKSTKQSKKYLKNYIRFYDRLNDEVSKNLVKLDQYSQNPQLNPGTSHWFKPNISQSKRSFQRSRRHSKPHRRLAKSKDTSISSLNNSRLSLARSCELVRNNQEHFFRRMRIIFSGQRDELVLNSDTIALLTEVQFNAIFKLLQEFEGRNQQVSIDLFEKALREHYQKLLPYEKQSLRSHETRQRYKRTEQNKSTVGLAYSRKTIEKDYLGKLGTFV